MFENHARTKTSSKECVMKLFEVHLTTKCGMHKSKKLNYFEHSNTFESCKQPGIDNKSSHSISEMVSFFEIKFQVFCLQKNS